MHDHLTHAQHVVLGVVVALGLVFGGLYGLIRHGRILGPALSVAAVVFIVAYTLMNRGH